MELVDGPYFADLTVGDRFAGVPGITLAAGHAAVHQAILGDRLRLPLDDRLSHAVTGTSPLAHPGLVWDVAIGQSTVVTRQVRANLFYRGLACHRYPTIGDTLHTSTEVVALRQNTRRQGRPPTGLAVLRVHTEDQDSRPVLDFHRCAVISLRDPAVETGHRDSVDVATTGPPPAPPWDLTSFRAQVPGEHFEAMEPGRGWRATGADVVSSAPELARLTLNIATVHHDATQAGARLVYGGHTIGLALAQLGRAVPNVVTVTSWDSCDHTAPVHEGDSLTSEITVTRPHRAPRRGPGTTEDHRNRPERPGPRLAPDRPVRLTRSVEVAGLCPVLDAASSDTSTQMIGCPVSRYSPAPPTRATTSSPPNNQGARLTLPRPGWLVQCSYAPPLWVC